MIYCFKGAVIFLKYNNRNDTYQIKYPEMDRRTANLEHIKQMAIINI